MTRVWHTPARVLAGLVVTALYAMPQANFISARPGAINYIEGTASINGDAVSSKANGKTFLNRNDVLSTEDGKAEVLLTPGVFLRVGSRSEVKMISPSLTHIEVEIVSGDAMVEVAQLVKENDIQILDHGTAVRLVKTGLYRFNAEPAVVQTVDGRAELVIGNRNVAIKKGHEVLLTSDLKPRKIDSTLKQDDLYAWSKVRDQYVAAASFSAAKDLGTRSGFGWGSGSGYGFAPGWMWNPMFSSWAWLPGTGAYYSPFGYGFYSPNYVAYAPVIVTPVNGRPTSVPVNPSHPATGSTVPIQRPTVNPGGGPVTRPNGGGTRGTFEGQQPIHTSPGAGGHASTPSASPASRGGASGPSRR
jgi:hypothetical protein